MKKCIAMAVVCSATACGNVSGHLSSTKTGDVSRPVERKSPVDELRSLCGDLTPIQLAEGPSLMREPYLQQVTNAGAMLGWVTDSHEAAAIRITNPDGEDLGAALGVIEDAALRSAGEKQMWSQLTDLQPGTTYCYQLTNAAGVMTPRTGFKTAPAADNQDTIRFLAFGDSGGGGADQYSLQEQMYTVPYDLIVHTGDVAYDSGTIQQYEDNVFGVYADLFRNIPFFPASGNHDYGTLSGAPFREVFNLPGDTGEKWYSYDYGRIHFVALDTEEDYATQASWLEKDLAASTAPWKIVYMHKPMYSSGEHGSDVTLRNRLAHVFKKFNVQLVLAGHDHDYERAVPQDGTAYVVTGGGGVGTRSVGSSSFTAFSVDVIHFVQVEVGVDELTLHAIDGTGREFDSMVVPRISE